MTNLAIQTSLHRGWKRQRPKTRMQYTADQRHRQLVPFRIRTVTVFTLRVKQADDDYLADPDGASG